MRVGFFDEIVDWAADDVTLADFADFPVDDFDVWAADDAAIVPFMDNAALTLPDFSVNDWTFADAEDWDMGQAMRANVFVPPTTTDAAGFFSLNNLFNMGSKALDLANAKEQRAVAQMMTQRNPAAQVYTQRAGYPNTMYAPGSPQYAAAAMRANTAAKTAAAPWYKRPEIIAAGIGLAGVLLTVGANSRRSRRKGKS